MPFDPIHDRTSSFTISDDGITAVETPTSTLSTTFDTSGFGSGSSVLSSFEPPADDLLGLGQAAALTHFLDDPSGADASLEELEAVISKLQAIYLYRQGLKALTEERIGSIGDGGAPAAAVHGVSLPGDIQAAMLAGSRMPANRADPISAAVPGSPNSIWRMNAATDNPTLQYPAGSVLQTGDFSSLAQLQYQLHQDMVRRYKSSRNGGRHSRFPRRRTHRRQASSPAALRPPQWADPSWHPMTAVLAKGELAGAGTGVFIPSHNPGADSTVPNTENSNVGPGVKMATADDLPEEWLY